MKVPCRKPELKRVRIEVIDGEIWRGVVGYEGAYEVSDLGRIKCLKRRNKRGAVLYEKIMKQNLSASGYRRIQLVKDGLCKIWSVHIIVALAFIGGKPTPRHQVNHKDLNKQNNRLSNLEWCTPIENSEHAFKNGAISQIGEGCHLSKLSKEQALDIFNSSLPKANIAKKFNVSKATVSNIKNGRQWRSVTDK
jgi:hypothetical protein